MTTSVSIPTRLMARIGAGAPRAVACAVLAALMLGPLATRVEAQPALKPGLWETQIRNAEMEAALKQMQQQLAAMPAEQRAQMEKIMSQKGASMGTGGAMRVCHSADSLKQRGPVNDEPGCTTRTQWAASGGTFEMNCKDGRTGKGEFSMTGGDTYRSSFEMNDPKRPGKPFRMEQTGRWVSADCGNLKPVGANPPSGPGKH
ncbi:MAG TPA: DUF3617 family protein [Burkholderiaceae bacterium]|jgi:hypothetical protein|nr:DUF3617 family protein [Burkholderiaceae bacterium]